MCSTRRSSIVSTMRWYGPQRPHRRGYLADAQLALADTHDIALDQLPTSTGFNVAVDLHATIGEQQLRVGSGNHDIGEFEELPEPDDLVAGRDRSHVSIFSRLASSLQCADPPLTGAGLNKGVPFAAPSGGDHRSTPIGGSNVHTSCAPRSGGSRC